MYKQRWQELTELLHFLRVCLCFALHCKGKVTWSVQKVSRLVLFFRYEWAPRDAAASEHVLTCLDLFAHGTLALASLSLMRSQIKNKSVSSHSE
jgi:hypothetical protein